MGGRKDPGVYKPDPGDYSFADPTGQFERGTDAAQTMQRFGMDQFSAMTDPGAYMRRFQQDAEGMASLAQGAVSPMQQRLNALAADQAQQGLDMAATEMSGLGALHSGAAQRAMGQAMATPFAQAQADIGRQQVGLTGQLMQQAGQRQDLETQLAHQLFSQGTQQMGQMGMHAGTMVAPVLQEQASGGQRFGAGLQGAMGGAAAGAPLGPWGMAGGAAFGGLGGIFSA